MAERTIAGLKVVELPLPDFVQFALVGQREACVTTKGGKILMAELNDAGKWEPLHEVDRSTGMRGEG